MAHRRSGRKIDFTHWQGFLEEALALGAGTVASLAASAQHLPETLLRTRGNLLGYVDAVQTPGALASVAVGMILVPEGTGATVLWSPATDTDAPWFWYEAFHVGYEEGVTDVVEIGGVSSFRAVIDSKAMRIIKNHEIQIVYENTTIGNAVSVNVAVAGRFLAGT